MLAGSRGLPELLQSAGGAGEALRGHLLRGQPGDCSCSHCVRESQHLRPPAPFWPWRSTSEVTGNSITWLYDCLPAQGRETEGQERRTNPKSQEAPLGISPAGEDPYQIRDSKLSHHFADFKMILTCFLDCPPPVNHNYKLTLPFVGRNLFKQSQQVSLLWGCILHFSLPLIPPQTYMSRNRELRHDTLMFLSGDALCSHRKGGRSAGELCGEGEERNHSAAPVEIHIPCMFLSHLK